MDDINGGNTIQISDFLFGTNIDFDDPTEFNKITDNERTFYEAYK